MVLAGLSISATTTATAVRPETATGTAVAGRAAGVAAAAPTTTTKGAARLTVDPATGLSTAGGSIAVTGTGFKTSGGLYVAVCAANGKAPASLADCVGGPVPDANTSRSWAHIGPAAASDGGPVVRPWAAGGSFAVSLTLPRSSSASDALDCSRVACAVYTTPDNSQDASQRLSIPVAYRPAPGTTGTGTTTSRSTTTNTTTTAAATTTTAASSAPASSSSVSTPASAPVEESTSVLASAPSTVQAVSIRFASVAAGGQQEVLFGGFARNEAVTVRLYSAPQSLPAARADANGVVKIDFTVPAGLDPGTHYVRVDGATSKVTGIATFLVTAPASPSPTASSRPSSSAVSSAAVLPSAESSATSSAPVSTPASAVPGATAQSTAASGAAGAGSTATDSDAGSRPVWPWFVLGLVLLVWAGLAAWLLQRRHAARIASEQQEKERLLAFGAAAEQQRAARAIAAANPGAPEYQQPPQTGYPYGPTNDGPTNDGPTNYGPTNYLGGGPDSGGPDLPTSYTGYAGYHPGEHGLLSGRDGPDDPGLLSGRGAADASGAFGGETTPTRWSGRHADDADAGPPTGAFTPDFTSRADPDRPPAGGRGPAGPAESARGGSGPGAADDARPGAAGRDSGPYDGPRDGPTDAPPPDGPTDAPPPDGPTDTSPPDGPTDAPPPDGPTDAPPPDGGRHSR